MGIAFIEGFENVSTADLVNLGKWSGRSGFSINTGGRYDDHRIYSSGNLSSANYLYKIFPTTFSHTIIGFAFKVNTISGSWGTICSLRKGGPNTILAQIIINESAGLSFCIGGNATNKGTVIESTENQLITPGSWNYLEISVIIGQGEAGHIDMHLNGVPLNGFPSVGVTTAPAGVLDWNTFFLGGGGVSGGLSNSYNTGLSFDDIYIIDNFLATNLEDGRTFLGDSRVTTLRPYENGSIQEFSVSDLRQAYEVVYEKLQDGDTGYVYSNVPDSIELFQTEPLSIDPQTIHGIQLATVMRKDETGARTAQNIIGYDTNNFQAEFDAKLGDVENVGSTYRMYTTISENVPGTTEPWTTNEINSENFQVGVRIVS